MAHRDHVAAALRMEPGERLLAAVRAAPRGTALMVGIAAGLGAALGYVLATSGESSVLRAAVGGGAGGGAGAALGVAIASLRARSRPPGPVALSVALTQRRLVVLRRSLVTNRPLGSVAEVPLAEVAGIDVSPPRPVAARRLRITFGDGSAWDLEAARPDHPEELVSALEEARSE